ncbi:hypothetical protein ACOSP7_009152 [Xanthoceras sorbifolium]
MLMALNIKNKEGFVNGTIKQPLETSTAEIQQWRRCNNLVRAWIFNSISQDIGASIIYNENRFSRTNSVHLFHIEEAIHDCKQDSMTIGAYYTKLKGLWDERDALCCIPTCTCGIMKEVLQFQQNQKTMKFLIELNEVYSVVQGQILLMDLLPTVNKAHSLILQDERQRGISKGGTPTIEASAFAVKNNFRNSEKSDQREHNNFSSKANHTDANASFTLTAEQCQNLMTLLAGNKSNSMANYVGNASAISDLSGTIFCASIIDKEMCWILDTGATDHMVFSADLLTTSSRVTNRTVHLPNGSVAVVTHIGSIHFADFVLHDVLSDYTILILHKEPDAMQSPHPPLVFQDFGINALVIHQIRFSVYFLI